MDCVTTSRANLADQEWDAPIHTEESTYMSLSPLIKDSREFETAAGSVVPTPRWQTLPLTGTLPEPIVATHATINGTRLWYGIFNTPLPVSSTTNDIPIILLHGGFANSNYWSRQVRYLARVMPGRTVITLDSRGQGRSLDDVSRPLTYELLGEDVVGLMDYLQIPTCALVGWSDGACAAMSVAMRSPSRVDRVFAFAGTYSPDNLNSSAMENQLIQRYVERVEEEYKKLQPAQSQSCFADLEARVGQMWESLPQWNEDDFATIPSILDHPSAPIVWVVGSDHEEAIKHSTPPTLSQWVRGSSLLILPGVSHFAFMQDPEMFNSALFSFLSLERPT